MVTDAAALPEQLVAVVEGMAAAPEQMGRLVETVLDEPDTDPQPMISGIKTLLSIDSIVEALQQLRSDAVEIVQATAAAVRKVARHSDFTAAEIL